MCGFVPKIVRAHNCRVAARIATADPSFFEHRDASHIVLGSEVIGGREAMPAAAHHNHIIRWRRFGAAPGL